MRAGRRPRHGGPPRGTGASAPTVEALRTALQAHTPRAYTGEEAREAIANLDRFFAVLERWAAAEVERLEGPDPEPSSTDPSDSPSPDQPHYVNLRRL